MRAESTEAVMAVFIYTPRGYVNLDRVEMAPHKKNGKHGIVVDGEEIDDNNIGFLNVLVSVVPVQGDWECLTSIEEEDGSRSVLADPVLAWGLDTMGILRPITASEKAGVEGDYALRKHGENRVYGWGNIGGFSTAEEWLSQLPSESGGGASSAPRQAIR
jgi:hypothetical protein